MPLEVLLEVLYKNGANVKLSQNKLNYRLIGLICSVLTITIIGFLVWITQSESHLSQVFRAPTPQAEENGIDFILEKFSSRQFDQAGSLLYELYADRLTHYPKSQTAHLEEPIINFYNDLKAPWVAQSKSGVIKEAEESILLTGDVQIAQQFNQDFGAGSKLSKDGPWRIESEAFTLYPKLNELVTHQPVLIASQTMRIRATGLKANTLHHEITLLNKVKGLHRAK